jgi:hypothetical protein
MTTTTLSSAWDERLRLQAHGDKLRAEADKLWAGANKLSAEGHKLSAEGDKLWAEAILAVHGNIKIEWLWNEAAQDHDCILETGECFVAQPVAAKGVRMNTITLSSAWAERVKLSAEANKLIAEGHKLWAERDKLRAEGLKLIVEGGKLSAECLKLRAEGHKLYAEGYKLHAEGNNLIADGLKLSADGYRLWVEAILAVHGNIEIEWVLNIESGEHDCILETGERFVAQPIAAEQDTGERLS